MSARAPTVVRLPHPVRPASAKRAVSRPTAAREVAAGVVRPLVAALHAWRRWRRVRAGLAELRALDDRMLADLGLDRGGVERAARRGRA